MSLGFEWSLAKASRNLRKHRVTFDEATSVFRDRLAVIFEDPEHSESEEREIIIGHSVLGRLLVVSFVQTTRDLVRLISARAASRLERRDYEEGQDQ